MAYVKRITVLATDDNNALTPLAKLEANYPEGAWHVVVNQNNEAQDFSKGAGGKYTWIFYQETSTGYGISAVRFIKGEDAEPPEGWGKRPVDLNQGAGGKYIYLCYTSNPDTGYISDFQAAGDLKTDLDVMLTQDTNQGAGGDYIYLGYNFN